MYLPVSIQTTIADAQLSCLGSRRHRNRVDTRVCNSAVKNICSSGILCNMGYGLQLISIVICVSHVNVIFQQFLVFHLPYFFHSITSTTFIELLYYFFAVYVYHYCSQ